MTFTLAVVDPARGLLGAVTASRSMAVGPAVLAVDPARGIAVSQAWTNQHLKGAMLRGVGAGASPQDALADALSADEHPYLRQCGVLALDGRAAASTGSGTTGWAGHRIVGPAADGALSVMALGNCLTGPAVLEAMLDRLRPVTSGEELARVLVDALLAGDGEGGDARGRQSAAVLTGRLGPGTAWPFVPEADLRIDDSPRAPQELSALVDRWRARERI